MWTSGTSCRRAACAPAGAAAADLYAKVVRDSPFEVGARLADVPKRRALFPDACCIDRVTPGEPHNWRRSVSRLF